MPHPWLIGGDSRGPHNLLREIDLRIQGGKSDHLPSCWQVALVICAPADLLRKYFAPQLTEKLVLKLSDGGDEGEISCLEKF